MKNTINDKLELFSRRGVGKPLYVTVSGSTLYGTNDASSDLDYKGIYLPSEESMLLETSVDSVDLSSNKSNSKNSEDDIDVTFHSVQKFMRLVAKGETGALDLLFSIFNKETTVMIDSEFKALIEKHYMSLITKKSNAFVGYCNSQAKKFAIKGARYDELVKLIYKVSSYSPCLKLGYYYDELREFISDNELKYIDLVVAPGPRKTDEMTYLEVLGRKFAPTVSIELFLSKINQLEESYGHRAKGCDTDVEWKSLSHAVRVIDEVEELLTTKRIVFPLKGREFIYNVKRGNVPLDVVTAYIQHKMEVVDKLVEESTLPTTASVKAMNAVVLGLYKYKG